MADANNTSGPPNGGSTALVTRAQGSGGISFVRFSVRPPFDDRLILWQERNSETAASFRLLRQRLIDQGDPRVMLCTTASTTERATPLAVNLALAFAELEKHRVLLVETTFKEPTLGEIFGFKPPQGFAGQLARQRTSRDDSWVVVQISTSPLFVLAADPRCCQQCAAVVAEKAQFCGMCGTEVTEGATPVLDAVAFAAAARSFRDAFDYVVIDAPAVLSGGDVNLIQDASDAIVFATRKGRSEAQALKRAIEQVAPARVAAVALFDE